MSGFEKLVVMLWCSVYLTEGIRLLWVTQKIENKNKNKIMPIQTTP
jgi:hypothetical protein